MRKSGGTLANKLQAKGVDVKLASEIDNPIRIPTGLYALDNVINGGIPCGAAIIFVGRFGSTKSSICYKIAGNAQKILDKPVALIHTETPFDSNKDWAISCGLPYDDTFIIEESNIELALDSAWEIIRSGEVSCLIIDSFGGLMPKDAIEKIDSSASFSAKSSIINKFYRGIAANMPEKNKPIILATNHHYLSPTRFGQVETIAGGEAQKFMAAMIIKMTTIETGEETVKAEYGNVDAVAWMQIKWHIEKSKLGPSKVDGTYRIYVEDAEYPKGTISEASEALIRGILCGEIRKTGAWFIYNGIKYHGENRILPCIDVSDIMKKYEEYKNTALKNKGISSKEEEEGNNKNGQDDRSEDES